LTLILPHFANVSNLRTMNSGAIAAKVALTVDRHSERSEESPYYGGGDPSLRSG